METFLLWPMPVFALPGLVVGLLLVLDLVLGGVLSNVDFDFDLDVEGDMAWSGAALDWLGVGKVPLGLLLELTLICVSLFGILTVQACRLAGIGSPTLQLVFGAVGAVALTMPSVSAMANALRHLTGAGDHAADPQQWVGRPGLTQSRVSRTTGLVRVEDGPEVTAFFHGDEPLPRGCEVVVQDYDAARNAYQVDRFDKAGDVQ